MGANCSSLIKEEPVQEIVDVSPTTNLYVQPLSIGKERGVEFEFAHSSGGNHELNVPDEFRRRDTPPAPCVREELLLPHATPQQEDEELTPRMHYQELPRKQLDDACCEEQEQLDDGVSTVCQSSEAKAISHEGQAYLMPHFEQLALSEVKKGRTICTTNKSSVLLATWRGSEVILKSLKTELKDKDDKDAREVLEISRSEMIHEINILTSMRHPNVISLLGANLEQESPFFVTEYCRGGDVESYLQQQRQRSGGIYKPPLRIAMQWATSFAQALAYIHGLPNPVIHRDLKPMNLLLTRDLVLKVADFGIAKVMHSKVSQTPAPKMTGGVGTWRYMAPEVVRFQQYTDRIDVYAFSLIVYLILTGRQPFHDFAKNDPELILKAYLRGEEPRPTVSSSTGTPELCRLMEDAWHVNAAARPSAEECARQLVQMAEQRAKEAKGRGLLSSLKAKIKG